MEKRERTISDGYGEAKKKEFFTVTVWTGSSYIYLLLSPEA